MASFENLLQGRINDSFKNVCCWRRTPVQLIQSCGPPASGLQYPATVLCGVAPPSPCVASPPPWPLLPLMTFRSHAEGVTLGNAAIKNTGPGAGMMWRRAQSRGLRGDIKL